MDTVRIRRNNGKEAVLSLDSVSYFEVNAEELKFDSLSKVITGAKKEIDQEGKNAKKKLASSGLTSTESVTSSKKTSVSVAQPIMFDFNAVESRGLIFETCYWQNDVNALNINPTVKAKAKSLDPTGELNNKLGVYLNKISNCAKIHEFDPKFGRIQPIMRSINDLCEKYNEDFLYELLSIILINSVSTYKESLNKTCTNRVIRLSDAVVCFKKKRYEEMAYYSCEFYRNVKLTEQNFDNFLFVIPYLMSNGYNEILQSKRLEIKRLSESRQMAFAAVYNNVKASMALQTPIYAHAMLDGKSTDSSKSRMNVVSKVLIEELKDKVEKLIHNENFSQAYNLVEKRFKENPENEELSVLLQYVGRVRSNATKYKNLPSDGSFYSKALKEWHIYENIPSAKSNFRLSIKKKERRFFSAIMDYVELIMHTDGERMAVETLMSYKNTIQTLDSDSRIKYYEKLASLYLKGKDYKKLLQCLYSLRDLYKTKLRRYGEYNKYKGKNQAKVAGVIFRISQCQYMQSKFQQSIDTAQEALFRGYNLNACVNQIVSCYISQNDFDSARDIVEKYRGKDYNLLGLFDKIDTLEKAYCY